MKLLMKIFSIVLTVALVCIIAFGFFFPLNEMPDFALQLIGWLTGIVFPIIIVAFGCYAVQMKNSGIFIRVILAYMIFAIIVSACFTFIPLYDINEDLYLMVAKVYGFLSQTYLYVFAFVLISMVDPNNAISNIIKKIAIAALIVTIIVQVVLYVKMVMVDKLPNVYGHDGFNFATIAETEANVLKIVLACFIVEVFSIILAFITNYAFEVDTIDAGDVDYYELKKQADSFASNQIYNMYTAPVTQAPVQPDRSASSQGLMNVNNQLGVNSNVGKTDKPSSPSQIVNDIYIPSSSGPVVNDAINQNINQPK